MMSRVALFVLVPAVLACTTYGDGLVDVEVDSIPITNADGKPAMDRMLSVSAMWDGTKVNGVVELRQALLHYSPAFVRNVTEKMMTYALGRGVEYFDMPVVRSIVRDADKNSDKFSSIVLGVVRSAPFQMRVKMEENAGNN